MTTERLIEHRAATLDIYRRLLEARSKENKSIPEAIATAHNNLEQNCFMLAIVGKVKAGKSTFINALLKNDLLPTGALQATSAIIEILHAEKPFLRVTYANGVTEDISPENGCNNLTPITEKLREVAAISDEERDLPIAQLNNFIINLYNPQTKQLEFSEKLLDLFMKSDLPNIHNIPKADLNKRSRKYIEKHSDGKNVAMRIELGFPSAFNFDHFRIVDTPGICAKGGFAERTYEFLVKADGIIYLHKEEPSEETLHNALQNVVPERVKKHMLLVLTHKSQRTQQANEDFLSEAQKCCDQIAKDRIFIVDSLTETVLPALYGKDMEQISKVCSQNEEWKKCISDAYMDAAGSSAALLDLLEDQSNMRSLRQEILRMAEKSLGLQIETVLGAIKELYEELQSDAAGNRASYEARLKDPQQFAAELTRQKAEMDELEAESARRVREIQMDFNLDNPSRSLGEKLKKIIDNAQYEINGKTFGADDTVKTADDYLNKINQDVDDLLQELENEIKTDFRQKISDMEASLQAIFDITIPKIPLTEILEELKAEATETVIRKYKKEGVWNKILQFISADRWGTGEKKERRLDATRYFNKARTTLINKLGERKVSIAEIVKANIEKICDEYQASVHRKLNERRDLCDDIQSQKKENEQIKKLFNEESKRIETAQHEINECDRIQGDL